MQEKTVKRSVLHPSFRGCRDQMLTMVILIGLNVFLYGARPAIIILTATVFAVICDLINALFRQTRYDISDLSSICFAWIFALMMPASCNYLIVAVGTVATVLLGKWVFGGWNGYPSHPAAFGFAFTAICYSSRIFRYPKPFTKLSLGIECTAKLYRSPSQIIKLGGTPAVDMQDLIVGNYSAPMGTTFFLILLAALILLIVHREFSWHVSASFLFGCAVWAFLFPRINAGSLRSLEYELLSGGIAFAAVYLVNEPTTIPSSSRAKLIYGFCTGILSMLFTRIGVYALGTCFALLLISPLSTWLDKVTEKRKVYVMSAEQIEAETSADEAVAEEPVQEEEPAAEATADEEVVPEDGGAGEETEDAGSVDEEAVPDAEDNAEEDVSEEAEDVVSSEEEAADPEMEDADDGSEQPEETSLEEGSETKKEDSDGQEQ